MYGYLGDARLSGTPRAIFQDLASKPSVAEQGIDCRYVVTSIHVTGKIATASIAVDNFFLVQHTWKTISPGKVG